MMKNGELGSFVMSLINVKGELLKLELEDINKEIGNDGSKDVFDKVSEKVRLEIKLELLKELEVEMRNVLIIGKGLSCSDI